MGPNRRCACKPGQIIPLSPPGRTQKFPMSGPYSTQIFPSGSRGGVNRPGNGMGEIWLTEVAALMFHIPSEKDRTP